MKCIKFALVLVLVVLAAVDSRRHRRQTDPDEAFITATMESLRVKFSGDINKFAELSNPTDQASTLSIIDAMINRLQTKWPQCVDSMKGAKEFVKRTYRVLAGKANPGAQTIANQMAKMGKEYQAYYQQAINCWLESMAQRKAAKQGGAFAGQQLPGAPGAYPGVAPGLHRRRRRNL